MKSINLLNLKYIFIIFIFIIDITIFNTHIIFDKSNNYISFKIDSQKFSNIENFEQERFFEIENKLKGFIEMTTDEQRFVNGMVRKVKPKKIVEIGVAYGGTSAIILNAIKDIKDSKLYSIDISKKCYRIPSKNSGFIVNETFPYLMDKWKLFLGDWPSAFLESIGNGIDFVYLDTVHTTPGEMINWIEILPFLKEEAFLVMHDVYFMYYRGRVFKQLINTSNNQLLSYIRAQIILPSYNNNTFDRNIAAFKLWKNQQKYYLQYFMALGTLWQNMPTKRELDNLRKYIDKYYNKFYLKIFNDAIEKNLIRFTK